MPCMGAFYGPYPAFLNPDMLYCWNDDLRILEVFNADQQTKVILPYPLDVREVHVPKSGPVFYRFGDKRGIRMKRLCIQPFGDCEAFGLISIDGIHLWTFNPRFALKI